MRAAAFLLLFFLLRPFFCFAQNEGMTTHRFFNNFEQQASGPEWINTSTITFNPDSFPNHFSKTDSANPYSAGIEMEIPADLKRKNFKISVSGAIQVQNTSASNQLVISIEVRDSAVLWKGFGVPGSVAGINEWQAFHISTLIPRSIPATSRMKIFLWNADAKYAAGLDDLEILFTEVRFPTYLPE